MLIHPWDAHGLDSVAAAQQRRRLDAIGAWQDGRES